MSVRIGGKIVAGGVSKDGLAKTDFSNITNESRNVVNWSTNATNCLKRKTPQNISLELKKTEGSNLYAWYELFNEDNKIYSKTETVVVGDYLYTSDNVSFCRVSEVVSESEINVITNEDESIMSFVRDSMNDIINETISLISKAGSKVCVPNGKNADGSNKFDEVTVVSDITNTTTGAGEKMFLSVYNNGGHLFAGYTTGGTVTERPVSPINYVLYYNTTTNKVEFYNGSTWISNCSFPISLYTRGSTGATSIDQVFNTVGYIGSTAFALPNITILIPNRRNADGSLNNLELVTDKVSISEIPEKETTYHVFLDQLGNLGFWETDSTYTNYYPTPTTGKNWLVYDEDLNVYRESNNGGEYYDKFICIIGTLSNKKVKSFKIKNVLRFVDYSDYDTLFDNRIRVVSTPPVEAEANTYYFITG